MVYLGNHPIEGLIKTALESIKEMVNVDTIVGDAVETPDGSVIIPISRVTFGFVAGGGEFYSEKAKEDSKDYPFGGGSGAGVSVQPVAFMIVSNDDIKLLPVGQNAMLERIMDATPQIIDKITALLSSNMNKQHSDFP